MNAHIPQSYEAATELSEIAAVPHQIVTPRHAKPVIGVVQDTLVGSYRLTRPNSSFNRREFMNMMMWNKRFEGTVPQGKMTAASGPNRYSGQQILSELLPPINMEMGNGLYKDNKAQENLVKIVEGEILQGILDKDVFSKPSKGIIHTLFKDYGSSDTVNFIDSMQNTVEQFLVYNGFSVGISDLIADEETRKQMEEVIKKRKTAIENILLQIHMDLFENNTGKTNQQEFEDKVFGELNKATDEAGKIGLGSLSDENRLVAMVRAGSKGSNINIAQMMACVGQQAPEGRRIPYGFTDRTLPHYKKYDDGAEARGFVESSFIKGLTPQEFFFHAMSGREGLIDTAVKSVTADTEIVIMEAGQTKTVRIGDWIDAHLAARAAAVEHFPEEADLEMLQLEADTYIPSVSPEGKVSWGKVAAVTRHDPGDRLYKVETLGGRSVIVTASKSLLVWNPTTKLFENKATPDVRPGECMPVTMRLPDAPHPVSETILKSLCASKKEASSRPTQADCVLDEITSIEPVSPDAYPKMYDLTVPETFTFGLANGLMVYDTADTGYIQRQLVKAMEDLVVQYDGTVRDSRGNITQFYYGEDGINATKIESVSLGISKLSEEEIRKQYGLVGVELSPLLEEGALRGEDSAALAAFVEQVLADRRMLVEGIQKSKQDAPLFAPVNVERILTNVATSFRLKAEPTARTDLTPLYVLQGIERMIQKTQRYHRLWAATLRFHLAPHRLIVKERFTRRAFDAVCEMILVKNYQSWVQPGEQVGIIAAQSIGEPSTQMSAHKDTLVHIQATNGEHFCGRIADFVDALLANRAGAVKPVPGHADSVVLDLDSTEYAIVGVSTDEKTSWRPISQVSRHPANGGLVRVTTKSGRTTTATLSHSFLRRTEKGIAPVLGSDLKTGMRIPIATYVPEMVGAAKVADGLNLTHEFGFVCGVYLACGSLPSIPAQEVFLQKHFGTASQKKIGPAVFSMCREFQQGVLAGYMDTDGNVNAERHQIRVSSRSLTFIRELNRLMGYCGFFGVVGEETSVRIPGKVLYTLNILKKYAAKFQAEIGFIRPEKAAALEEIVQYCARENKHDTKELYDKIPEIGHIVAEVGKTLDMPAHSRYYGRWTKKESIGRLTLESYVEAFKERAGDSGIAAEQIELLEQAVRADVLWDEIVELAYLDDPKEYVYDFTVPGNDSFMVDDMILVHNTLNSVDWDTEIMIAKDGQIQTPAIGEFIDTYANTCDPAKIQHLPNGQIYIPLEDTHDWKAISCDENGNVKWTQLEAITRHPVVNADGSDTILKVTTESGRVVKATKGRSFLTRVDGKVKDVNGSDLRIGDVLPIASTLAVDQLKPITEISLRGTLAPSEFLYGTDAQTALACMEAADAAGQRRWFQEHQGSAFTVPYRRSDTFRDAISKGRNMNAAQIHAGKVYPARTRPEVSQIPETLQLTAEFGFFAGAYLAEGSSNTTQVNITNNDVVYLARIKKLMDSWNVGTHLVAEQREAAKTGIRGKTTSLVIHSTLLATIMTNFFGRISTEKTMPDWVLQAPSEFIAGLLDGYISGDGSVSDRDGTISFSSASAALITRLAALLTRFGIFTTQHSYMPDKGKFETVHMQYTARIPQRFSKRFAELFTLTISQKHERLSTYLLKGATEPRFRRDTQQDVIWDKIKTIEEVRPMGEGWVYDLTVSETRNFMTHSCLLVRDTFHLAGVAAKSNVTRGVPRLKELLKVSQNPKAISLTIPLKPELRGNKEKAREVAQDLELTLLKDITIKTAIYYDPNEAESVVEEDRELIKFYHMFEQEQTAATTGEEQEQAPEKPTTWSGWLLRFELDREHMFRKNISMDDVAFVLRWRFGNDINLIYSDYNSNKLIMRMRLPDALTGGMDDLLNLKRFQARILNGIVFRGVLGIKSVTFREDKDTLELNPETGKYEQVTQYMLDTDGSNFLAVMRHPYVDAKRLTSSHVHDMYEVLGIEATRQVLLNEITTLFEEAGVNNRHLGLLCDVMTRSGRLMPVDRHGINKTDIGPLAKASFEETDRILLNAALYGEMDPVTGVSANIMMGQPIRGGTGFFQVLLDEGAFLRLQEGLPPMEPLDEESDVEEPTQEQIDEELYEDENDLCSSARLRMNMTMPKAHTLLEEPDVELAILDGEGDDE